MKFKKTNYFKLSLDFMFCFVLQLTSQNPYVEDFIGRPFVYTIDINNQTEVEIAIKEILNSKVINIE